MRAATLSRRWLRATTGALALVAGQAAAAETIEVGVVQSLSGTVAISETTLKDVMLMLIEEKNEKGDLPGEKVEPVIVDAASHRPLFAEKARELLSKDKVAAVFGCWTSVSRKSVLPVFQGLAGLDTAPLVGHLAAWNYFMSVDTPENKDFIEKWHAFIENPKRVADDPTRADDIGFDMWVKAVEKAGTTDPDAVIDAMIGIAVPNLSGGCSAMMPNRHVIEPVLIGEIRADGPLGIVRRTPGLVVGDECSDDLEGSKDRIADRRAPIRCGNFDVETGKWGGR